MEERGGSWYSEAGFPERMAGGIKKPDVVLVFRGWHAAPPRPPRTVVGVCQREEERRERE